MEKHKMDNGDRVKDVITGMTGIVVCVTTWMNGCRRLTIQPEKLDKDGKVRESVTQEPTR